MAILAAMQSAATRLIGQRPTTFFGGSGQFELEVCDLVNEVAIDVAKYQDWQALVRLKTITGDGESSDFILPSDYDRMLQNSQVQDLESWAWGYGAYTDINAFLSARERGFSPRPGGWIIFSDRLQFAPVPADGATATFPYITKNWARAFSTATKAAFDKDDDSFLLPERLLTLGLVWRWRENKRLDASGDQEAFVKALDEYAAKDRGARSYRANAGRAFPGTYAAWPWELGPSTYIDH